MAEETSPECELCLSYLARTTALLRRTSWAQRKRLLCMGRSNMHNTAPQPSMAGTQWTVAWRAGTGRSCLAPASCLQPHAATSEVYSHPSTAKVLDPIAV